MWAFEMDDTRQKSDGDKSMSPAISEKNLEQSKNDSLTSVDIQEMEKVRLSLKSMLQSSENFLHDDKTVSPKSHLSSDNGPWLSTSGENMFPSLVSAQLMSSLLDSDAKELKTSTENMADSEKQSARTSADKKYDKTLLLENTLLNETLEKERSKRKHCEQQIKVLQSKLLETQQELAAAVSADRKKDVMINQLDKTLARVVEDWKKHEEEKFEAISKLEEQHENDAKFQQRQQDILVQFEKDITLAAEALSQEQQRAMNVEREKDNKISVLIQERDDLGQRLEEEVAKNKKIDSDFEESIRSVKESQRLLEQEKLGWQDEKSQLESQIQLITKAHTEDLESEKKLVEREKQVAEDSQRVLSAVQKEVQQLTVQLDTCFREKENLKTEITLLTAKYEAQRTRRDSEHRAELERQISKNLRDAQSQLSKSENEIKNVHKKQIENVTKKYRSDLEEQLNNFHEQLKEKDRKLKETTHEYEERLAKSHNDLVSLSTEREALRNEKQNMIKRLQRLMQSHCSEAMSILTSSTEQPLGISGAQGRHDVTWMPRQTPSLVTSTSNVEVPRDTARAFSSFVTPINHAMHSSSITTHGQVQQQLKYTDIGEPGRTSECDETVHNWVRLPVMQSEPSTSYIRNGDVVFEMKRGEHVESDEDPREGSQDPDVQEEKISPTTTSESLLEQSTDGSKIHLPTSLSTDMLNMFQQQQSRQSELNHYVRQLLKKSPGSASDGDVVNVTANLPEDGKITSGKTSNFEKSDVGSTRQDELSSESAHSDLGEVKQVAFTKSAATPVKRYTKIPMAQTPPSKDKAPDALSKSSLTPEQVGQLARLIEMYQKDTMENELPSPQKMFQYLRGVQNRGEIDNSKQSVVLNPRKLSKNDCPTYGLTNNPKESNAKRKLQISRQQEGILTADNGVSTSGLTRKHPSGSEELKETTRRAITSDSELTSRTSGNKNTKTRRSTYSAGLTRTAVRKSVGKPSRAWK